MITATPHGGTHTTPADVTSYGSEGHESGALARAVSGPSEAAQHRPTTTNDDRSGSRDQAPELQEDAAPKIPDETQGKKNQSLTIKPPTSEDPQVRGLSRWTAIDGQAARISDPAMRKSRDLAIRRKR